MTADADMDLLHILNGRRTAVRKLVDGRVAILGRPKLRQDGACRKLKNA